MKKIGGKEEPCPFCWNPKATCREGNPPYFSVICEKCNARGPRMTTVFAAIHAWNKAPRAEVA